MAIVYVTGFETGDSSEFSATTGTASVQTGTVMSGGYSLKVTSAGTTSNIRVANNTLSGTTLYARFHFRVHVTTNPGSDQLNKAVFFFVDTGSTILGGLRIGVTTTGTVTMHANAAVSNNVTADVSINADQTYLVEVKMVLSTTVGTIDWKLDGVQQAGLANENITANQFSFFRCQSTFTAGSVDTYFDDIQINDAAYPGDGQVICRQGTTGTPTYNAWTKTGLTTSAACWSETPFSATNNCNLAGTAAGAQTMLVSPFSSTQSGHGTETIASGDTINACQQSLIAKVSSTSSPPTFSLRRRIGGTDTDLNQTLTTADVYYKGAIFTTTTANLDTAEIGANRGTSAATKTDTVEDAWLMTDFTVVAAPPPSTTKLLALTGVGQ